MFSVASERRAGIDSRAAWERLVGQPVAVLATLTDAGRPHLVPIVFAAHPRRRRLISAVDAKPKASRHLRRLDNIRARPEVAVLVHHYEADWARLWWVRADGRARVSDRRPADADLLREKYPPYADQALGPWIVIDIDSVTGWAAPGA